MKVKIRTPYDDDYVDKGLDFSKEKLLTVQDEVDNCDVNKIIERYEATGLLPQTSAVPTFGDFSNPVDYQTAQNIFIQANDAFMSLDAKIRKQFDNDPVKFLEFVDDPKNADELLRMGLREAPTSITEGDTKLETAKAAPTGSKEPT